ncbi:MAG TPA: SRPBCC family protein [Polyangia bacterium]|nr:SRPBCC family protein [Polyangia bacterium]
MKLDIDDDITRARTLPGAFYGDGELFARARERIFARAWHWAADATRVAAPGAQLPFVLAPGLLDEPLLFTRDRDALHCLSNVCTHRANLVCPEATNAPGLRCRYHGRRFGLDGRFASMPEFEGARDFPSEADHLPRVPFGALGPLLFAALDPAPAFADWIAPLARLGGYDFARLQPDAGGARDYEVAAHWALYCDNYLEGFHIPYVHPELSGALDYSAYCTELYPFGTLQIGVAADGEDAFDALDNGRRIAGYYFWFYPATMLNFYPWGLSLNVVTPLAVDRTRVAYRSYVSDPARRGRGAGGDLELVEHQDEAIVERVQAGARSRLYRRGRYSPSRETGVHHFHKLLARALGDEAPRP